MSFKRTTNTLTIVALLLTTFYLLPTAAQAQEYNTPEGTDVEVIINNITLIFPEVTQAGSTTIESKTLEESAPTGFQAGDNSIYYDIETTAEFTGSVELCLNYDDSEIMYEVKTRLMYYKNGQWQDITSRLDTIDNIVCGKTYTFSNFAPMVQMSIDELGYRMASNFTELSYGNWYSLMQKQRHAHSLNGQSDAQVGILKAIKRQLAALSGKKLPALKADYLISYIDELILYLSQ